VWVWGWNINGQLGNGTTTDSSVPVQAIGLNNVTDIASGNGHCLALESDGSVWGWGYNYYGEIGSGATGPGRPGNVNALPSKSPGSAISRPSPPEISTLLRSTRVGVFGHWASIATVSLATGRTQTA